MGAGCAVLAGQQAPPHLALSPATLGALRPVVGGMSAPPYTSRLGAVLL